MQNHGKIQGLIVVIISNVIVLALLVGVLNFTYAENPELHQKTLEYLYEKPISLKQNAHIPVGEHPSGIGVDGITHKIYVSNALNNNVSVIDGQKNTKIGNNIPVGRHPIGIGVDEYLHKIYVANSCDNTVSVLMEEIILHCVVLSTT